MCEQCQVEESVVHVIMECNKYQQERQGMQEDLRRAGILNFNTETLMNLSRGADSKTFFDFIKQTGLIGRI